jgi:nucleotide-binding universal stress UspA family protein
MAIKDILLPLTSFPVATETRTIENVVSLAENLKARVSAVAFEMDIESPIGLYADPIGISGILAADRKKSADNARDLLSIFETIAIRRGIQHDHSLLPSKPLDIPARLADEARLRDVTVLPLKAAEGAQQTIAEHLIFESGRPILVLPDDSKRELPRSLDSIAVAWDFSRPATRAVADALPFLQQGKHVRIFTVVDDKVIKKSHSGVAVSGYLARHGVEATPDEVKSNGRSTGEVFKAYVAEHKIDLLVMGGYGHSRMREFILGGATMSILAHPPTWVLMSH